MKTGYASTAVIAAASGLGMVAVVSDWWRFLLALVLLAACAAVPVLHVVYGPAKGGD